ncbi:hypothetical protein ACP3V5_01005 [Vibrio maritimus]
MKRNLTETILLTMTIALISSSVNGEVTKASSDNSSNNGYTVPKPLFQLGDVTSEPYPDKGSEAKEFISFFNATYGTKLELLGKKEVVWFPPQRVGDTSLELVARVTDGETENCSNPEGYPILCEDSFSTGQFCQACHDSALFVEGGGLPEMSYFSEPDFTEQHSVWLANWSQYGDWNANIMRLATRDPIWQAQIETETNKHPYADPLVIQDVCFSCHGEMGERQLKMDLGMDQVFCTDIFYATIPGTLSDNQKGKPFPFNEECAPITGKPVEQHQQLYAKYGSLSRDGVSCETCHRIGPTKGAGEWDGKNFEVFYGAKNMYNVVHRQTDNPVPLEYEFTATFEYDLKHIMAPDTEASLDIKPMLIQDDLKLAQAINMKTGDSYLRQSVLCGSCHVLIVPQIPTSYKPGASVPTKEQAPYYDKPSSCDGTFAAATRKQYGNPVTDDCVGLGYEQATYLEWINSDFASEEDNENTCQACHMPYVTNPENGADHTAIMAQSTTGLTPKSYRRHRLMGINSPVFEMFMQFPDVLGVSSRDDKVPPSGISSTGESANFIQNDLLNGQMAIVQQATSQARGNGLKPNSTTPDKQAAAEITINSLKLNGDTLEASLNIVNNTGHKFPSGAGFRRAFIKFEVLDKEENTIWVSGQTNPYGAICNGPCQFNPSNGTYNLLASEVNLNMDPKQLQPHYSTISKQNQVQIYEVQAVNDIGVLTSQTLSLFHDAKDNRLLPKGFMSPEELGCKKDKGSGNEIFGIPQCSAAYATKPQLEPLTVGSRIGSDKHYTDSKLAGSDTISYSIPKADIDGIPHSIRVTLEYQTIPPAFLAQRFKDGYVSTNDENEGKFLPATERSIYLSSHLNTNLKLKSEHPDNPNLTFSQNWTISIYEANKRLNLNN